MCNLTEYLEYIIAYIATGLFYLGCLACVNGILLRDKFIYLSDVLEAVLFPFSILYYIGIYIRVLFSVIFRKTPVSTKRPGKETNAVQR